MNHIHIDKVSGGTNDERVVPYSGDGLIELSKLPQNFGGRLGPEIEIYRLEALDADDVCISFWVEESMPSWAALCKVLLRYAPKGAEVRA